MLTQPFYQFTALHSFLIGLFPFYIPVYLFSSGNSLHDIFLFVAATGGGYCLTLFLFDRLRLKISLSLLIGWSFFNEVLLLILLLLFPYHDILILLGIVNGLFSCTFWTIQRLLFVSAVNPGNSGRHFGNTQILVMLVLKAAILIGGFLLDKGLESIIFLISVVIVAVATTLFIRKNASFSSTLDFTGSPTLSLKKIITFKDNLNSRSVFSIDGVFLYLESYFWLISLFLVVKQDYMNLGILTVVLALLFSVLFFIVKNKIDKYPDNRVYPIFVSLYTVSWLLRAMIGGIERQTLLLATLTIIAFFTSLFRLSFNKRYFDNAKRTRPWRYVLIKSYISQFFLMLIFLFAAMFSLSYTPHQQLTTLYLMAAIFTPLYLLYRAK